MGAVVGEATAEILPIDTGRSIGMAVGANEVSAAFPERMLEMVSLLFELKKRVTPFSVRQAGQLKVK